MFGSYQINHSLSCLADNFKKLSGMNISINDHLIQGTKIITTKIQSRHREKKISSLSQLFIGQRI